jgi:hypothetical protein
MEKVRIRNNSRRGLMVRLPGRALHLQPGEEADVPRGHLDSEELSALVRSGQVLALEAAPAVAAAVLPAGPEAEPAAAPAFAPQAVAESPRPGRKPR